MSAKSLPTDAPDLPGLHTQGEDIEDATRNAEETVALYVEGFARTPDRSTPA